MPNKPAAHVSDHGAATVAGLEQYLQRHRRAITLAIVVVAILLRVACYVELAASPCFWWHEWRQSDLHTFHTWALTIAEGDWWSQTARPPLHHWHRQIAEDYARQFPQKWAALNADNPTNDPDKPIRSLWERWCGGGRTYQGPFYPYLIAGTYALLGPAVGWVYAWQMLLGTVSVVLILVLTRRYFGELAAVVAAGFALLYGPLLYFEFTLLRATLIGLCGLLLVYLLDRAREKRTRTPWLLVGILLGLSVALKAHFVVMVLAAVVLVTVWCWKQWSRLGRSAALLLVGLLLGFSPVVVRNAMVGAPPLSIASNGPPTFLISNAEDSSYIGWGMRHAAGILERTDSRFLPTVIATLKTHPSLTHYLGLLGQKMFATWFWYEEPNNANFYYARLHSRTLALLPVSFGLIGPPAIVGLVLALRRLRRCAPLFFLVLANLAVLYFFFVFGRFRLPLAAALLPFAGFGVSRLVGFVLGRRWKATGAMLAACAALALLTLGPSVANQPTARTADVHVGYQVYYDVLLRSALAQGDLNAAAEVLRQSLTRQPSEVRVLGPTRPARSVAEAELATFYAEICQRHAYILQEAGRATEAEKQLERSAELLHASGASPRSEP